MTSESHIWQFIATLPAKEQLFYILTHSYNQNITAKQDDNTKHMKHVYEAAIHRTIGANVVTTIVKDDHPLPSAQPATLTTVKIAGYPVIIKRNAATVIPDAPAVSIDVIDKQLDEKLGAWETSPLHSDSEENEGKEEETVKTE